MAIEPRTLTATRLNKKENSETHQIIDQVLRKEITMVMVFCCLNFNIDFEFYFGPEMKR